MGIVTTLLYILLLVGSIFLILLVLIQRGRGGGLAGALGGMGGSSAFGTRAGDVFTKVTIGVASAWILCAMILARINVSHQQLYSGGSTPPPGEGSFLEDSPKGSAENGSATSEGLAPESPSETPSSPPDQSGSGDGD